MADDGVLGSKDALFIFLTALTKRAGGELRLKESELSSVTKDDALRLLYDKNSGDIVLSTYPLEPLSKMDLN